MSRAPWLVLGLWLLIDLIVAAFFRFHEWGPGGTLTSHVIYMGFIGNAIALTGWTTVWLVLSPDLRHTRLLYFLIGVGCVLAIMQFGEPVSSEGVEDMLVQFAKLTVGIATLLTLVRGGGWRISARHVSNKADSNHFQFSVFDLLVLTTGTATFISLSMFDGTDEILMDFLHTGLFVITVIGASILAFSLGPIRLAVAGFFAILVFTAALTFIQSPSGVIIMLASSAVACLIIAIGSLRWFGYRLVPVA